MICNYHLMRKKCGKATYYDIFLLAMTILVKNISLMASNFTNVGSIINIHEHIISNRIFITGLILVYKSRLIGVDYFAT